MLQMKDFCLINHLWFDIITNEKEHNQAKNFLKRARKTGIVFGIILVWKLFWNLKFTEKTNKISSFRRKILPKMAKSARKSLILIGFWKFFKTPKRNAVGSIPITDAKRPQDNAVFYFWAAKSVWSFTVDCFALVIPPLFTNFYRCGRLYMVRRRETQFWCG